MLRAVIHAGLHKTGTTSFQRICNHASGELLKSGIYYPKGKRPHHNHFANLIDTDWIRTFAHKGKKLMRDGCLLVSAENFEYRLHHDYPEKIERALYQSGINISLGFFIFAVPFHLIALYILNYLTQNAMQRILIRFWNLLPADASLQPKAS